MEGNIVNIPLKGIARAGSNQSCEDGLCNEIIGLEWKDGSYVPVGFGETTSEYNGYARKIWIHKTTDGDNTLVLFEKFALSGGANVTYDIKWVKDQEEKTLVSGITKPIEKIGIINNTIRIEDKVFLFYNDQYNELNISDINFSMQLDVRRNGVALLHDWCDEKVQKEFTDGIDTWEGTWVKQNLKQLESEVKNAEYLTGMAFMRYAIKLYDGTYIKASAPVLVCDTLQSELNNFSERNDLQPNTWEYEKLNTFYNAFEKVICQIGYLTNIGWKFRNTDKLSDYYKDDKNGFRTNKLYELNTMVSGDVFFREEEPFNTPKSLKSSYWDSNNDFKTTYYDKDYSSTRHYYRHVEYATSSFGYIDAINGPSSEILQHTEGESTKKDKRLPSSTSTDPSFDVWSTGVTTNENWFKHKITGTYDFEIPSEYCYRASGLGIYYDSGSQKNADGDIYQLFAARNLSSPIFRIINNLTESNRNLILSVDVFMTRPVSMFSDEMNYSSFEGNQRKFKSNSQLKKELNDSLSGFYKIYEIPFDKLIALNAGQIYMPYIERGRISQIEQQETLLQPYQHSDYFDKSYNYNNRIHISGLKTKLFNLYDNLQMICTSKDVDSNQDTDDILVEFTQQEQDVTSVFYGKIKINNRTTTKEITPCIIYPDERIKKIKLLGRISGQSYYRYNNVITLELEQKNGFSIYNNLTPINIDIEADNQFDLPNMYDDFNIITRNGNIFKVSSANNLIDFPLINTYQVGNGDIVGFASSTKALSQGQFGQFPLYVFTTEGIWAMTTNGQGTYTSAEPLSREVCCNPNGILEIDGAVLFTTNKGLMLLSGSEVVPFAPLLVGEVGLTPKDSSITYAGENIYKNAVSNNSLVTLENSISMSDFREYVSDLDTRLSYIYDKNKVLVYNKKYNHSYLIDISTSITTKIAESIQFDNGNYPEPEFGIIGNKTMQLKTMAYKLEPNRYTQTMFQTRPIKLGTYDLKSSFRVVLRGKFDVENDKKAGLYVLGSNDTERWMYLGGTERGGSFYDLGTTIHRVSCKYFMVIYVGSISGDSKINGLEISSNVKYNNKLK